MADPGIEVVVGDTSADRVVVELDKESIELALVDDALHLEVGVIQGAFGRGGDQVLLAGLQLGETTKVANHGDIASLVGW